jgi:hypothetical protein
MSALGRALRLVRRAFQERTLAKIFIENIIVRYQKRLRSTIPANTGNHKLILD